VSFFNKTTYKGAQMPCDSRQYA